MQAAERLLDVLELMAHRAFYGRESGHRRNIEWPVAAHKRLWGLRQPME